MAGAAGNGFIAHVDEQSYQRVRISIGIMAALLPILLVVDGWLGGTPLNASMSAYYHTHSIYLASGVPIKGALAYTIYEGCARDIFVGLLCAIGAFLLFHRGYTVLEDWLLNFAGALAFVVALTPMYMATNQPDDGLHHRLGAVHLAAAATFFLLISLKTWLCSRVVTQSGRKLGVDGYRKVYVIASVLMAVPAVILLINHFDHGFLGGHAVFWAEFVGVETFAGYWIIRAWEVAHAPVG